MSESSEQSANVKTEQPGSAPEEGAPASTHKAPATKTAARRPVGRPAGSTNKAKSDGNATGTGTPRKPGRPRKAATTTAATKPTKKPVATKPAPRTKTKAAVKPVAEPAAQPMAEAATQPVAEPKVLTASQPEPDAIPAPAEEAAPGGPSPTAKEELSFSLLETRLMSLQQDIRALNIPVAIVFEGWDKAGKATMLGELLEGLDPRGYQVHVMGGPTGEEKRYPPARRYWTAMPAQGHISLFLGSWYGEVSTACLRDKGVRKPTEDQYAQIAQMESQLICDGTLLIKLFFNISKKEQKRRQKALASNRATRWRVTREDLRQNERYEEMMQLFDAMMAHTHFDGALWHVLRSDDKRAVKRQLYEIVIDAFEKAIAGRKSNDRQWDTPTLPHVKSIPTSPIPSLSSFVTNQPTNPDYKEAIDQAQKKLRKLHGELYQRQIPLVLCFEGWDAAGKGGCIRRLTSALDPRGFQVIPIAAPTPEEKSHHHLWRFWKTLPKDGHIAIFDRSWYGRVMVERIEGFCTEHQWRRAYEEMNQFEHELYAHGAVIRKFWLQIDNGEQLRRFESRQETPEKQWKITDEDWRNRDKWPQYEQTVNEMLQRTHTDYAPWVVVEADNKRFARLKVLNTVIEAIEQALEK